MKRYFIFEGCQPNNRPNLCCIPGEDIVEAMERHGFAKVGEQRLRVPDGARNP